MFTTNIDFAAIKKQQSKLGKDFSEASDTIQHLPISTNSRDEILAILKHEYDCRISETMRQSETAPDIIINSAKIEDGVAKINVTLHDQIKLPENYTPQIVSTPASHDTNLEL